MISVLRREAKLFGLRCLMIIGSEGQLAGLPLPDLHGLAFPRSWLRRQRSATLHEIVGTADQKPSGGVTDTCNLLQKAGWWAHKGSNLGPLPCEGNALPLSYAPGTSAA